MKVALAAVVAAAAALAAASTLGVASAEAPTVPPLRSVSVQGVSIVPISQTANAAMATAAYRQGMAAAVADGQAKAEFLVGKAGGSLGAVQSIVEGGGYISCSGGEEPGTGQYEGAQPDFGSSGGSVVPLRMASGVAAPKSAPAIRKPAVKHRKRRRTTARKASVAPVCTLSADVALAYAIN
jgi:hypothetical protein